MSNLENNTAILELILEAANALPDAVQIQDSKTVTPTTSEQTVAPDDSYDALAEVVVEAIPTTTQATPAISVSASGLITASSTQTEGYVAAGTKSATEQLTTQAATTITPSTESQTAVAKGTYTTGDITVDAMPTAEQATPSITVDSTGLITASATQTAGYVAAGTKSATQQLTTQAAKTITPSAVQQTAVASGRYTTGAVTVAKIPDTYVQPRATIAATTYTPTTADQTIAARTYCSGAQTILGDTNLVAENIKSGVSIFGVSGSYEGSGSCGVTNETCEVTISSNYTTHYPTNIAYTSVDSNGKVIGVNQAVSTSSVTITCVKGSTLAVKFKTFDSLNYYTNASLLFYSSPTLVFKLDDDATMANITNTFGSSSGGV